MRRWLTKTPRKPLYASGFKARDTRLDESLPFHREVQIDFVLYPSPNHNVVDTVFTPARPFLAQLSVLDSCTTISNHSQEFKTRAQWRSRSPILLTTILSVVPSTSDTRTALAATKRWHDHQFSSKTVCF